MRKCDVPGPTIVYLFQSHVNVDPFDKLMCLLQSFYEYRQVESWFNWQSSKSRNDGTYLYKRRWGAEEYNHCYLSKPLVDIDEITSIPLETVKEEANGCYILPYGVWG